MNVNNPNFRVNGVDLGQLFKAVLVFAFFSWIGQSFISSIPKELQEQASQLGFVAGIMATKAYNFAMLLYLYNKPVLTRDPSKRKRVLIGVFTFNALLVGVIGIVLTTWPTDGKNVTEVALTFIQPERMTPSLISLFQMIGIVSFGAGSYYVMSMMMGIQNFLAELPDWPATWEVVKHE